MTAYDAHHKSKKKSIYGRREDNQRGKEKWQEGDGNQSEKQREEGWGAHHKW
jgi:hypothetical protein